MIFCFDCVCVCLYCLYLCVFVPSPLYSMAGSYGWTREINELSTHDFVKLRDFRSWLNGLLSKEISVKEVAREIRTAFDALDKSPPFEKTSRFPDDGIFVDISEPSMFDYLLTVMGALDVSDRNTNINFGVGQSESVARNVFQAKQDSKQAFKKRISDLNTKLSKVGDVDKRAADGIYTRDSFEKRWNLTWTPKQ